jgi:hypothetical protein
MSKPYIGIVLTQEAALALKGTIIWSQVKTVRGEYVFNCREAEQVGALLRMVIEHRYADEKLQTDVLEYSIPLRFILYTVQAQKEGAMGFLAEEAEHEASRQQLDDTKR